MRHFLRETMHIAWWAFFQPALLQNHLDKLVPRTDGEGRTYPTNFLAILLALVDSSPSRRLLAQFTLLWFLASLSCYPFLPWEQQSPAYLPYLMALALPFMGLGVAFFGAYAAALVVPVLTGIIFINPAFITTSQTTINAFSEFPRSLCYALLGSGLGMLLRLGNTHLTRQDSQHREYLYRNDSRFGCMSLVWITTSIAIGVMIDFKTAIAFSIGQVFTLITVILSIENAYSKTKRTVVSIAAILLGATFLLGAEMAGAVGAEILGMISNGVVFVTILLVAVAAGFGLSMIIMSGFEFGFFLGWLAPFRFALFIGVGSGIAVTTLILILISVGFTGMIFLPFSWSMGWSLLFSLALTPLRWPRSFLLLLALTGLFLGSGYWLIGIFFTLVGLLAFYRLPLYPAQLLYTRWLNFLAARNFQQVAQLLDTAPFFLDDLIFLPLYGFDNLLVAAGEQGVVLDDIIAQVAASPYQGWAAREARLALAARQLSHAATLNEIAAGEQAFAWLAQEARFKRGVYVNRARDSLTQASRAVAAAQSDPREPARSRQLNAALVTIKDMRLAFSGMDKETVAQFSPVAEQWCSLLLEATAERLENPYIPGNPLQLQDSDLFVGRADLYQTIQAALNAPRGKPTLALYGARRMGKTTVLLQLPRQLPEAIVPVFIDLQGAQANSEGAFYWEVARAMLRQAGQHRQLPLPAAPDLAQFQQEPSLRFNAWLDEVEASLAPRPLLLAFDEFEALGNAIRSHKLPESILATMRHLMQHRPWLYLLFAGVSDLSALGPNWHSYFISAQPVKVSYLDTPHARRLIQHPIPNWPLDIPDPVAAAILTLTRAHPFLVQLVCSELVNWINTTERRAQPNPRRTTLPDVEQAAARALRSGAGYFTNLWEDAGPEGQRILGVIAHHPAPLENADRTTLERLKRLDLIEQVDGNWQVQVELTRRWLAQQV